jgi:hypothetical protein
VSTGCPPSTTRATTTTLDLGYVDRVPAPPGQDGSTRRCVGCGTTARSSCRRPASVDGTATTPRAPWQPDGRRGHRLHQVLQEGAPGGPGQGRRLPGQPQDRGDGRRAPRGDPARPGCGRSRPARRAALGRRLQPKCRSRRYSADGSPTARAVCRSRPTRCSSSPARPAASSRRSRPTWPRAPAVAPSTCSTSPPRRTPSDPDLAAFRTDKDGLKATLAARMKERRRAPDPGGHRQGARPHRAARRGADGDPGRRGRRWHGPLPLGRPHQRRGGGGGHGRRARAQRQDRRPAARSRAGDQPQPAAEGAPRIRPRLRRQDHRLVQRVVRRAQVCRSVPASCSPRSPDASATRARPTTARPTTCCARSPRPAPHPAADPGPGPGLDRLGRHRHGHPWLHPQDHGDGRRADAAAGRGCRVDPARGDRTAYSGEVVVAGSSG